MNPAGTQGKPHIVWMEGLLDLYNVPFPHNDGDPRAMGFVVGRQIIALYIAEMLLKYALDARKTPYGRNHNLLHLFRQIPRPARRRVETKYMEILNSEVEKTWDFAKTVDSLLEYLGDKPITETRYFWESSREHGGKEVSILFIPRLLHALIFSLFIVLHDYPSHPLEKRFDTEFESLEESFGRSPDAFS